MENNLTENRLTNAGGMLGESGRGIVNLEEKIPRIENSQTADCLNTIKNTIDHLQLSVSEIHAYLFEKEFTQAEPHETISAQASRIRELVSTNAELTKQKSQLLGCLNGIFERGYMPKNERTEDFQVHPDIIKAALALVRLIEGSAA